MKRNINKIVAATLLATTFVACSDEIENGTYGTPYNANTSSIASAGTAVDLGLSSGTMWADKNVGAASSQDMGLSFIWGDATGLQMSAAANTYSLGTAADLKNLYQTLKKADGFKQTFDTIEISRVLNINVAPVDSVRPNYACDLLIERHADVKVKDAEGNFIVDEKGEYVREPKVFVEVEGLIVMANKPEEYGPAVEKFLKPYVEDKYNKYVIVKSDSVYFTDVIQKMEPVNELDIEAIVAAASEAAKKDVAWAYMTEAVYNSEDMLLYADLVIASQDTVSYFEGNNAEVAAYSIIGTEFDAATKNWGAGWAMPTSAQLEELIKECDWTFEGNGYKVSNKNDPSKFIFLPAAGYRYEAKQIGAGASGYYASGEVRGDYTFPSADDQQNTATCNGSISANSMANILTFNAGQFDNSKRIMNKFAEKNIGFSIRPVVKK